MNRNKNVLIIKSKTMVRKTNIEGQFDTYITIEQAKSELTKRQLELLELGMMVFTLFFIYNKTI